MKRVFHPGEDWLYLRLYMGPETAESWLANILPPLLSELKSIGLVRECFYIHYLDSSCHLRIRFKIGKPEYFGKVIQVCRKFSSDLLEEGLIWKSEVGSYDREIERYGEDWIETAEEVFSVDTSFWLSILPGIYSKDDGENERWQVCLLSVHRLLNDFSFPLESRIDLLQKMLDTLSKEIKGGKRLRIQIDEKYRKKRALLENLITDPDKILSPLIITALKDRSDSIKKMLVLADEIELWDHKLLQTRMADLIHMSLNRGLRSKHRMQELVIYSFLLQQYHSAKARNLTLWEA